MAGRSLRVFGVASGAGLVMAGISAERPEQSHAIDLAWIASGAVWITARLKEGRWKHPLSGDMIQ